MKIQELVIEGFQVFRDETSIPFSDLSFFSIEGENGSGKSTVIDAIAWVLFGKTRASDFKDSFINDESKKASVSLVVSDTDNDFWLFERDKKRGTGSQKIVASIYDEDTDEWVVKSDGRNSTAQAFIDDIVGMTVEAFFSFVVIDGAVGSRFISSKSDVRRSIMIQSIPEIADWDQHEKQARALRTEAKREKASIESKIEISRSSRLGTVEKMDALRDEYGKDIGKARLKAIDKEYKAAEREIKTLSADAPSTEEIDHLSDRLESLRESRMRKVKDEVDELKRLDSEIERRGDDIERLNRVFDDIDEIDGEIESSNEKLAELRKQAGNEAQIEKDRKRLQDTDSKIVRNNEKIDALTAENEELEERLELLGDPEDGDGECWVCKSELSHDQHTKVYKDSRATIKANEKKIVTLRERNEALDETGSELSRAIREAEDESKNVSRKIQAAERTLGSTERERAELMRSLSAEIDGETIEIDFTDDALKEAVKHLQKEIDTLNKDHDRHKKEAKKHNVETSEERTLGELIDHKKDEYEEDDIGGRITKLRESVVELEDERYGIVEDQGRHSAFKAEIDRIDETIESMSKELVETSARADDFEFLVGAMSPSGIPSMLIGSVLTEIEDSMNEVLEKMPGRERMAVEFRQTRERANETLESVLDIAVHTNSGAVRYAETFSSGQLVRLSVAAQFAFVKFLNSRRAGTLNTIFLDEPLGNLDHHTVPSFIELLVFMQSNGTVESAGVIAHDQRVQEALPQSLSLAVEDETAVVTVTGAIEYEEDEEEVLV